MESKSGIGLKDVQGVYGGPEGDLWELVMGQQIHIGGFKSSMDLAEKAGIDVLEPRETLRETFAPVFPKGADIVVDGRFVGNSPATLRLPEGTHVVEVRKDGLQPYRKEIHVTDKSNQTLRVRLVP
jgi:hypothetical protein